MRPRRMAGRADETQGIARRQDRACDDLRVEHCEVAVRPDLPVRRLQGQADPAEPRGLVPGSLDDGVGERVTGEPAGATMSAAG